MENGNGNDGNGKRHQLFILILLAYVLEWFSKKRLMRISSVAYRYDAVVDLFPFSPPPPPLYFYRYNYEYFVAIL